LYGCIIDLKIDDAEWLEESIAIEGSENISQKVIKFLTDMRAMQKLSGFAVDGAQFADGSVAGKVRVFGPYPNWWDRRFFKTKKVLDKSPFTIKVWGGSHLLNLVIKNGGRKKHPWYKQMETDCNKFASIVKRSYKEKQRFNHYRTELHIAKTALKTCNEIRFLTILPMLRDIPDQYSAIICLLRDLVDQRPSLQPLLDRVDTLGWLLRTVYVLDILDTISPYQDRMGNSTLSLPEIYDLSGEVKGHVSTKRGGVVSKWFSVKCIHVQLENMLITDWDSISAKHFRKVLRDLTTEGVESMPDKVSTKPPPNPPQKLVFTRQNTREFC